MAIQMRRGISTILNPSKLLPGEWAVCIDSEDNLRKIYMCFAPGVIKQIMTVEDAEQQLEEATEQLKDDIQDIADLATQAKDEATTQATNSSNSATASQTSATAAETSATDAQTSATEAKTSADSSLASANNSNDYMLLSKSWAIGETEKRTGEDTNNSKYFCQLAESYKTRSEECLADNLEAVDIVNKKIQNTVFSVDFNTGHLLYTDTTNYNFTINNAGHLVYNVVEEVS